MVYIKKYSGRLAVATAAFDQQVVIRASQHSTWAEECIIIFKDCKLQQHFKGLQRSQDEQRRKNQ